MLLRTASATVPARGDGFAFVACSTADPLDGAVRVFRVHGETWRQVQAVRAASPAHLVMHPKLPVLYVVHDVAAWDHRPRGAVSAFRFNPSTGSLAHVGTQPLSLSATHPKHAVLMAGAQALFVSAESGGIYNVLPIAPDGSLGPVSAIRKEFGIGEGSSAKPSAPRRAVLHADGSVYTADPGQETVSRFEVSRNSISLQHRSRIHAGAGASDLVLSSRNIYALNASDGSIALHGVTAQGISPAVQTIAGRHGGAAMRMHPGGRFLVTAHDDGLRVLRVHGGGDLTLHHEVLQPSLHQVHFARGGTELIGLGDSGGISTRSFNLSTADLGAPRVLAQADGAGSLLLHFA